MKEDDLSEFKRLGQLRHIRTFTLQSPRKRGNRESTSDHRSLEFQIEQRNLELNKNEVKNLEKKVLDLESKLFTVESEKIALTNTIADMQDRLVAQ